MPWIRTSAGNRPRARPNSNGAKHSLYVVSGNNLIDAVNWQQDVVCQSFDGYGYSTYARSRLTADAMGYTERP